MQTLIQKVVFFSALFVEMIVSNQTLLTSVIEKLQMKFSFFSFPNSTKNCTQVNKDNNSGKAYHSHGPEFEEKWRVRLTVVVRKNPSVLVEKITDTEMNEIHQGRCLTNCQAGNH